ncbi:type VII secretion target [Catellatospora sp. NPDC049609]|uniref:type VII secretion target n=1 Tax=Catellatospora sp. NPDC049609 TaxID=3155505 RepID=UPI00342839D2
MTDDRHAAPRVAALLPQIREHARTVARLADRAEHAYGAARHVTLDADAYGVICAVLPLKLMPLQARIAAAMRAAAADLHGRGEALRTTAVTYEDTDLAASARTEAVAHGRPG